MELKDTIEMMNSEDYKERFKAEYYQTKIRYDKLHSMLVKNEAGTLDFKPTCIYVYIVITRTLHFCKFNFSFHCLLHNKFGHLLLISCF